MARSTPHTGPFQNHRPSSLLHLSQGEVECSHRLLRQLYSLCSRLPINADGTVAASLLREGNDAQLMALLAEVTRGCHVINEVRASGGS